MEETQIITEPKKINWKNILFTLVIILAVTIFAFYKGEAKGQSQIIQNQTDNLVYSYLLNGTVHYENISSIYGAGQLSVIATQTKNLQFYYLVNNSIYNQSLQTICSEVNK